MNDTQVVVLITGVVSFLLGILYGISMNVSREIKLMVNKMAANVIYMNTRNLKLLLKVFELNRKVTELSIKLKTQRER